MTDIASLLELTKGKIKAKKKAELVDICKEHGLDESGTKDNITDRLWEFLQTKRDGADGSKFLSDEDPAATGEETAEAAMEEEEVAAEDEEDVIVEENAAEETAEKMEEDTADTTEKAKLIDLPDTMENKAFLEEQPPTTTEDDNNQSETPAPTAAAVSKPVGDRNAPNPNRLYFGNLAFDKVDQDVRTIFESCGEITDIHIIRDRYSRRSQGYGFITFEEEESKEKALKLDGKDFFGRPIKVNLEARNRDPNSRSKAKTRIFIKNIPKEKTEEDVKTLFGDCGKIENFFFIKDHHTDVSRGFGFMDFSTPEEAQQALSKNNAEAFGGNLIVKIAEEKNSRGGRGRGRGRGFGGRGRGGGWGGRGGFQPYGGGFGYGGGYGGGFGGYAAQAYGGYGGYGYSGYSQPYSSWGGTGGYGAYGSK